MSVCLHMDTLTSWSTHVLFFSRLWTAFGAYKVETSLTQNTGACAGESIEQQAWPCLWGPGTAPSRWHLREGAGKRSSWETFTVGPNSTVSGPDLLCPRTPPYHCLPGSQRPEYSHTAWDGGPGSQLSRPPGPCCQLDSHLGEPLSSKPPMDLRYWLKGSRAEGEFVAPEKLGA